MLKWFPLAVQSDFKLVILLQPPKEWDYRISFPAAVMKCNEVKRLREEGLFLFGCQFEGFSASSHEEEGGQRSVFLFVFERFGRNGS